MKEFQALGGLIFLDGIAGAIQELAHQPKGKGRYAKGKGPGKDISRPKLSKTKQQEIFDLQKTGISMNQISVKAKVA